MFVIVLVVFAHSISPFPIGKNPERRETFRNGHENLKQQIRSVTSLPFSTTQSYYISGILDVVLSNNEMDSGTMSLRFEHNTARE